MSFLRWHPSIEEAIRSRVAGFEDAVLEQSARLAGVDVIVTRNTKGFRKSGVKTLDPHELLSILQG
jgi:ribulose 1,5-bisphosphate carboxylase large subunit-like protein